VTHSEHGGLLPNNGMQRRHRTPLLMPSVIFEMKINGKSIIRHSISAINSVIKDFHENPFIFLYESDIQFALFSALRERINGNVEVPRTEGNKYVLNLVYSEYLDKIDIVCIDPEEVSKLDPASLKQYKGYDTYIYNLPVLLGIELKYVWMGYKKGLNILKRDFLKLRTSPKIGKIKNWVVLGFIQRNEEADSLLKDPDNQWRLSLITSVDHINNIYIITPSEIYTAHLKSH